jgi:hypothetical protein
VGDIFDPYYTWLGIAPDEQPADFYRLLGIRRFEPNADVISNASDRQLAHLRSLQTGSRAADCQRLLNEVTAATHVLLDPELKAAYDRSLALLGSGTVGMVASAAGESMGASSGIAVPSNRACIGNSQLSEERFSQDSTRPSRGASIPKRRPSLPLEFVKVVIGGAVGVALGYLVICWISPQNDFLQLMSGHAPGDRVEVQEVTEGLQESHDAATRDEPPLVERQPVIQSAASAISSQELEKHPNLPAADAAPLAAPIPMRVPTMPMAPAPDPLELRRKQLAAMVSGALETGDLPELLKVTEELAALDGSDALAAKELAIKRFREQASSLSDERQVAQALSDLIDDALRSDQKDIADRYLAEVLRLARKLDDQQLVKRLTLLALKRERMAD